MIILSDKEKAIQVISPVYVGSSHDFGILKEERLQDILPPRTPIYADTGFQGLSGLADDLIVRQPKKKPIGRKLNGGEQHGNRMISRERVKVEHSIGGFKRFKIVGSIFRGITQDFARTIKNVCALWNLHLRMSARTADA